MPIYVRPNAFPRVRNSNADGIFQMFILKKYISTILLILGKKEEFAGTEISDHSFQISLVTWCIPHLLFVDN